MMSKGVCGAHSKRRYDIKGPQRTEATEFGVFNQFEQDDFTVTAFELLCVPSEKSGFEPV